VTSARAIPIDGYKYAPTATVLNERNRCVPKTEETFSERFNNRHGGLVRLFQVQ
jgi:hypothetical protein